MPETSDTLGAAAVIGSCEPSDMGAGNQTRPLQKKQVLFTIDPSFQLQDTNFQGAGTFACFSVESPIERVPGI